MEAFEKCAAAGAAWLDEQKPGWFNLVDTAKIDMMDVNLCVAGQVFAEEGAAVRQEEEDDPCPCCSGGVDGYTYATQYLTGAPNAFAGGFLLGDAWAAEVNARRTAATVA